MPKELQFERRWANINERLDERGAWKHSPREPRRYAPCLNDGRVFAPVELDETTGEVGGPGQPKLKVAASTPQMLANMRSNGRWSHLMGTSFRTSASLPPQCQQAQQQIDRIPVPRDPIQEPAHDCGGHLWSTGDVLSTWQAA